MRDLFSQEVYSDRFFQCLSNLPNKNVPDAKPPVSPARALSEKEEASQNVSSEAQNPPVERKR